MRAHLALFECAVAPFAALWKGPILADTAVVLEKSASLLETPTPMLLISVLSRPIGSKPATVLHHCKHWGAHSWMVAEQGSHDIIIPNALLHVTSRIVA